MATVDPVPRAAPPTGPVAPTTGFFGHPRGLATLFFTEMWERFSYYGMRALLILFMTAAVAQGGLGFDTATAGAIYGLYTAFVYMGNLPGGWVADRLLGARRAVLYGGIVIALGHFTMALPILRHLGLAIPDRPPFFAGLLLIVVGTSLLKPNISTMVGELYRAEESARRDAGFSIFYMGINLGAFFAPLVCGYLGQRVEWHLGFMAAGVGMVLGLVQYVLGAKHLGRAGAQPDPEAHPEGARRTLRLALGLGGALLVALALLHRTGVVTLTVVGVARAMGLVILAVVVSYLLYVFVAGGLTSQEKGRVAAIAVFFLAAAIFWSGFEQAGSSLNLVAEQLTDRRLFGWEMPASWLQSVNPLLVIALAPAFAWLWVALVRRRLEPPSPLKFAFGLILLGAGFAVLMPATALAAQGVKIGVGWLLLTYLLHTLGELSLSPVGLSTVTKLAPHRMVGQMMGIWFMAAALGNLIAGLLAGLTGAGEGSGQLSPQSAMQVFTWVSVVSIGAGVVLALLTPLVRRAMGGVK